MTRRQIQDMQERIGVKADGFWGPVSIRACQKHLWGLHPHNDFPSQSNVSKYYGPHGEKDGSFSPPTKKIKLAFPVYYGTTKVTHLSPHELCAESLRQVFERLAEVYPDEKSRREAGILKYDGLYNPRPMRGGKNWSMHSWAIAVDLDAGRNGLWAKWPERAHMPLGVMECFAMEGFLASGAFWLRDSMHFQATT